MADVFISYKREERHRVERIARALQELGLSVWFDASLEGGGSFSAQINREVRAAKAVLVCWTPAAAHSEWVVGEAEIGRTRGVLAPAFLAPSDLPPPFNTIHAFDLEQWRGGHGEDDWLALLDRLGPLTGRAGLRHLALALAAGEPVRVMGANVAAAPRDTANAEPASAQPPPRSAAEHAPGAASPEHWFRHLIALLLKTAAIVVFGPFALWRMRRWRLLRVWLIAFVVLIPFLIFSIPHLVGSQWLFPTSALGSWFCAGFYVAGPLFFLLGLIPGRIRSRFARGR